MKLLCVFYVIGLMVLTNAMSHQRPAKRSKPNPVRSREELDVADSLLLLSAYDSTDELDSVPCNVGIHELDNDPSSVRIGHKDNKVTLLYIRFCFRFEDEILHT